jgi:polar amino acid transport system substrate-binding protein
MNFGADRGALFQRGDVMLIRRPIWFLILASLPFSAYGDSYHCVSFDYPPLVQIGANKPGGFAVSVVERVFNQMGHTVKIEVYPWARSLEMARTGNADCIFTILWSQERSLFLDYSNQSIVPQIVYFYARKGSNVSFNGDLYSLRDLRIGTAHKINYGPRFESARAALTLDEAPTIELNFKKLAAGRVDLVPSNWYTAASTLAQPSLRRQADKIVRLAMPIESMPTFVAFPKSEKSALLRDHFDGELKKFIGSPEYGQLVARYKLETAPAPP